MSQGRRKASVSRTRYPGYLCLQAAGCTPGQLFPPRSPRFCVDKGQQGAELTLMGLGKARTPEIPRELLLVGDGPVSSKSAFDPWMDCEGGAGRGAWELTIPPEDRHRAEGQFGEGLPGVLGVQRPTCKICKYVKYQGGLVRF